MPEIVTKYPDVVMQVLRETGAKCGVGVKQTILIHCPKEQFCSLPSGEICVYSVHDISQMTQLSPGEILENSQPFSSIFTDTNLFLFVVIFLLGFLGGSLLKTKK
jgi:hypothetical protein